MINKNFEKYKLQRELKRSGKVFIFKRDKKNKFNSPIGEVEEVKKICGLYHEQNSYISVSSSDAIRTRTKKIPMILCLYEDVSEIQVDDFIEFNDKKMKVNGITNIQEWGIIADISLEVIDYVESKL